MKSKRDDLVETKARQLLSKLTEGDGQPGYDLPPEDHKNEEREEVQIGREILRISSGNYSDNPVALSEALLQIRRLAKQLIAMHTQEPQGPNADFHRDDWRKGGVI